MNNNQLAREIEKKAKERLSTMSSKSIEEKASLEKKAMKINRGIWIAVLLYFIVFWIVVFCVNHDENVINNDSFWMCLLLMILAFLIAVLLIVDLYKTLHKSNKDLALLRLQKEIKKEGLLVASQDDGRDYSISKSIDLNTDGRKKCRLLFDNNNKVFQLQEDDSASKLYNFTDIINYEVYENGASKVSGTAGKALIGGAFFGLGGMIIGSSMGRTIQNTCSQLKLLIRLNDINNPQMEIVYINSGAYAKNSLVYKEKISNLQLVCSQLEYMINSKTLEESAKTERTQSTIINDDIKQQLFTLQEICKDGLITEEEFEQKKKQILGL